MKDIVILKKTKEKKILLKDIRDTTGLTKIISALNQVNFARKYKWAINNADIDIDKKLEFTEIKKY